MSDSAAAAPAATPSATEAGSAAAPAATPAATAPAATPTAPAAASSEASTAQAPEATYTQTELDTIVTERLNKKYKDHETVKAQAAKLPELETQNTTLQTKVTELESDFGAAVKDVNVLKVALDKGVPADLLDRLKGNTLEEIAADADVLMQKFGHGKQPFSGFNGGTSPAAQVLAPEGADAAIRRAAGY